MVGVSILAGKLNAAATKCWGEHNEEARLGNRMFSHLLEILAEAENDVKNGRVAPISETFDDLRNMLQEG